MPLAEVKEFERRQSRVYVISDHPPEDEKVKFKTGRTIYMNRRLDGYHLCYLDGFYMYKVIILNGSYTTETKKNTG